MENGFIRIPCSLMSSRAWKNGSDKQRVAMVTLCSVVTNQEFIYKSEYGDVKLEAGQMITSIKKLSNQLDLSVKQVRVLLQNLKNEQIISFETILKDGARERAWLRARYSILTINDLRENRFTKRALERAQEQEIYNKNQNNKEKINNKKESSISTKKKFVPPTAEEVQEYLDSKGITFFTGREFVDYYEQGGWVYGTNHTPIRNWKACVTTWLKHKNQNPTGNGNSATNIYTNGIAGREERMQRLQRDIFEHLAHPDPPADELFDF